jgi:hypothetical protein
VKDWARVEYRLALAKQLLDLQQLAVSQHGLQRRHVGNGSQHEDAIKARLLGELAGIDLKCPFTSDCASLTQIAAIGGIADQCLLATPPCILQVCNPLVTQPSDGLAAINSLF